MKILIVATKGNSLVGFRGKLIKEWIKYGHEVVCISIEEPSEIANDITQLGATYYQVKGNRTSTSIFAGFKMINDYKKAFKKLKPDVCFLYMSKPIAFGGLAAIKCHVPNVFVFVTGLEIAYYKKSIKNYIIVKILNMFYKKVHNYAKKVFFMNRNDYECFRKNKIIKEDKACFVNGSGVDLSYYSYCALPQKDKICMVGRLVWSKGIKEYIEAARIVKKIYPDLDFILVGGMDCNPESLTQQEIDEIKRESVITLCGFQKDVRSFIESSTIFVLPSYHEGIPRSIIEAEAIGRPIITTDAPGCIETVENEYNGFIVPVKNGAEIANKILYLLENPEVKEKMALNSLEFVKKFDVNKVNTIFLKEMGII